ncbi:hypothetical protein D3C76_1763090 [compost metagenome]
MQGQKFVHQNHMPGAADGQPFRYALDNAEENHFQKLNPIQTNHFRIFLLIE